MTYKENIRAILECHFTGFKEDIIDSACNRILEQEPRWIPVSERLPEESGDYLVTICYDLFGKGPVREIRRDIFYISTKRWLYEGDDVIAWMPLPKPYREVEG